MRTIREWTLESELGRGGMGVVYRARHRFQDGLFAVKVIRPELVADSKVRAYFVREATQAGKLEHEGIVRTHLPFEEGGELFLPMEHLAGETLQNILEREGPQPEARALRLVRQAGEALAYAHARTPPVIHRDVKPANLFVLPDDRVKLIDFGLARALDGDSLLSSAGRLPGTPVYLSPELLEGQEASPAADVFALGVVLFQLLTGSLPVELPAGGPLWGVLGALQKAHERGFPRVKQLAPWVSEAADGLSARLLARMEAGRPRDGTMVLRVLSEYELMQPSVPQGSPNPSSRPQAPAAETSLGVRGLGAERSDFGADSTDRNQELESSPTARGPGSASLRPATPVSPTSGGSGAAVAVEQPGGASNGAGGARAPFVSRLSLERVLAYVRGRRRSRPRDASEVPANDGILANARPGVLHSPQSVGIATWLGGPLAGGTLLAINYARLGQPHLVTRTVVGAIVGSTLLFLCLAGLMGSNLPMWPIVWGPPIFMHWFTVLLQGAAIERHRAGGGIVASRWVGVGAGVLVLLLMGVGSIVVRGSLVDHYYTPSGSMKPTVKIDDHIIVDKRAYGLRVPLTEHYIRLFDAPKRGDVVVLSSPDDGRVLLQRVVGLPGDDIAVRDGRIYLSDKPVPVREENGQVVEVLDLKTHPISLRHGGGPDLPNDAVPDGRIPPNKFLVMGDNRGDSRDGRFFGLVDRELILGRALGAFDISGFRWTDL
jgi:signal peptidase I